MCIGQPIHTEKIQKYFKWIYRERCSPFQCTIYLKNKCWVKNFEYKTKHKQLWCILLFTIMTSCWNHSLYGLLVKGVTKETATSPSGTNDFIVHVRTMMALYAFYSVTIPTAFPCFQLNTIIMSFEVIILFAVLYQSTLLFRTKSGSK